MGNIRLWTGIGERDENNFQCGSCYEITGTVNSLSSASENITFGIIDWSLVYGGQPLTALSNINVTQTLEFTSTGAFSETFDIECLDFIFDTQLKPNIIIWEDADIDIEITGLEITEDCQTEMCSECFFLQDNPKGILVDVENDRDAFGLKYVGVGNGNAQFKQQMLIPGVLEPIDYPYPVEEIHKFGDGNKLPIKTDSEETYEMVTKMLPDYMHDAFRLFLKHRTLRLNGQPFVKVEGTYTPEIDRERNLASQVAVDLQKLPQNKFDGYC